MSQARLRVAVIGAGGRMGVPACQAVADAEDLELVARVHRGDPLTGLVESGTQVAVELSTPDSAMANIEFCLRHGISVVVGTSGMDQQRLETIAGWLAKAPETGVVVAPNFSVGAVLMGRFAAQAARFFESVEIIEAHHPQKLDAPSGTAVDTARRIHQARQAAGIAPPPDATASALDGARGARIDSVPVHAVRLRGLIASQEVLLGGVGETLTIRHDTTDRAAFMPGVLLCVRQVAGRPGLTVGLEPLLGLDG